MIVNFDEYLEELDKDIDVEKLKSILASRDVIAYSHHGESRELSDAEIDLAMKWISDSCSGKYKMRYMPAGYLRCKFEEESDFMQFMLTWG